jgi:hypothetical protein
VKSATATPLKPKGTLSEKKTVPTPFKFGLVSFEARKRHRKLYHFCLSQGKTIGTPLKNCLTYPKVMLKPMATSAVKQSSNQKGSQSATQETKHQLEAQKEDIEKKKKLQQDQIQKVKEEKLRKDDLKKAKEVASSVFKKPPPRKSVKKPKEIGYNFDMLETDNSTDDEEHPSKKRPSHPEWSKKINRTDQLQTQSYVNIAMLDSYFSSGPIKVSLNEIFPTVKSRNMIRHSSSIWTTPPSYDNIV